MGIVETIGRPEFVRVLHHHLLGHRTVYLVGDHGARPRVGAQPPSGPGCAPILSYTP
jgi:hypothetical protein